MRERMKRILLNPMKTGVAFCLLFLTIATALGAGTASGEVSPGEDDTLLLFVGEDLEVLSIASKRQESAWQAPAIAQVLTREDLRTRGARTLRDALDTLPGFYMAQKEWGTQPYLRGIPDSVLFLYDTVPMGSDVSKFLHPLDRELSLAAVKRVEVIRGPGSVLWGPDAFGGIVNVVPMTGKDLEGVETGVTYQAPGNGRGVYLNAGHDEGPWDAFLSLSGWKGTEDDTACNFVRFWGDGTKPVPPESRFGDTEPGESRYFEASGRVQFRDWLAFSFLLSDYCRPYALSHPDKDITWKETRSAPFGFLKMEAKKELDPNSNLRFVGYLSSLRPEYEIINKTLDQKEDVAYGEIVYDRSLFSGKGILTGGISYREKDIDDAPIWDSYLPDYLDPANLNFLPRITEEDYRTKLWSIFGQYTHKVGKLDFLLGLRGDRHDQYQDHLSYNTGVVWSISPRWVWKILYGTAYRTPFARQLLGDGDPDLEKIETVSSQISWKPSKKFGTSVCGFFSRIDNHLMEDPYAGLSVPNDQEIMGLELEGHYSPLEQLDLSGNLTLIDNSGPEETYHYNDYTYWDGHKWVKHYTDLRYPYDKGPHTMMNLMGTWKPWDRFRANLRLRYFSSRDLIYPRIRTYESSSEVWLVDMTVVIKDVFRKGLELDLAVKNLANRKYETPGTYTTIEGDPVSAMVTLRYRW
jgi:outer membrane receptor protein involved in Fe transport